jgi:hypothetical protein
MKVPKPAVFLAAFVAAAMVSSLDGIPLFADKAAYWTQLLLWFVAALSGILLAYLVERLIKWAHKWITRLR